MFIYIIVCIILIIIIYFIYRILFIAPFVNQNKVKYLMSSTERRYIKRKGKLSQLSDIKKIKLSKKGIVFYCLKKWSTKNNNYIYFNDRYYIIYTGYYYYINDISILNIKNDSKIYLLNDLL